MAVAEISPRERVIEAKLPLRPGDTEIVGQSWDEISFIPEELGSESPIPHLTISLMGTADFGDQAYQILKKQGHKFYAIFAPDNPRDALRKAVMADNEKLPEGERVPLYTLSAEAMKDPETAKRFSDENTDLGVFASMTEMVDETIYNGPKLGTIGMHDSYLDEGRGGSAGANAIKKGKKFSGVSIYQVTKGTDEGEKYLQAKTAIYDTDTIFSLFTESTFPIGVRLLTDTVELIARGRADEIRKLQDLTKDTYEPRVLKEPAKWNSSAKEIYDEMRASLNLPSYTELLPDTEVAIEDYESKPHPIYNLAEIAWLPDRNYSEYEPGTIAEITDKGVVITTNDGCIRVNSFQLSEAYRGRKTGKTYENREKRDKTKLNGIQFTDVCSLEVGMKLASPLPKAS